MDDLNIKKLSHIKAEMFGIGGGDGLQAKPAKSKPTNKKKLKKHQKRAAEPSLEEKLLALEPSKLEKLDAKYKVLDSDGKLRNKIKDESRNKKSKAEKRRERIARANQPKLASFFSKTPRTPSTPSVKITHRHPVEDAEKVYTVQWDNVSFEDRYLIIKGVVPRMTIDLFFKPAKASFNFIKRRIANRLQPFKIQITNDQARLIDNIYLSEVIEYMVCQDALEQMLNNGLPDYGGYYNRVPSHLSALFFPKDKKQYLDILCDLQSDQHKIIPVVEAIGDTMEDAFLFTVERGGTIHVIWENTNLSRATYVFRVEPEQYEERLQFVFDYIVSNVRAKRLRLHSDSIDTEMFGDFEIINHTEVEAWRNRLCQIIR
jgi:hypothetical protein